MVVMIGKREKEEVSVVVVKWLSWWLCVVCLRLSSRRPHAPARRHHRPQFKQLNRFTLPSHNTHHNHTHRKPTTSFSTTRLYSCGRQSTS